ncbi:transporter substrate-binding domain-containing protein [Enterobacteriaceae bacterium RIT714]|nr:transporter substrate-binding domain-containing protein [Enterobacteriaceae bacterium RIT714]
MRKTLHLFIGLILSFCLPASAAKSSTQALQLQSGENFKSMNLAFSSAQRTWLQKKKILNVAVWLPDQPPVSFVANRNTFEGIAADYLSLLAINLGLQVKVYKYHNRDSALNALNENRADLMIDLAGFKQSQRSWLIDSVDFQRNIPALVVPGQQYGSQDTFHPKSLALREGYLSDQQVRRWFPEVKILRFRNAPEAVSSLNAGETDGWLDEATTASYLINRHFIHTLQKVRLFPEQNSGNHFVVHQKNSLLLKAINQTLLAISDIQHTAIIHQWSQAVDLPALALTEEEKKWLSNHRQISVSVNPDFAPFTFMNANNNLMGLSADILQLIQQNTGLRLKIDRAENDKQMLSSLEAGENDLSIAVSLDATPSDKLLLTRSFITIPYAIIARKDANLAALQNQNVVSIAIPEGNLALIQNVEKLPPVRWTIVSDIHQGLRMVRDRKIDAVVYNQISANQLIERHYASELKILGPFGKSPARIGFAVKRSAPELFSLMEKCLASISPREVSLLINKWNLPPDSAPVKQSYDKKPLYVILSFALILLLTAFGWISKLRRDARSRQQLQVALSQAKENAERANRAKSEFLAAMSHEIRTPISAIIGLLEMVDLNQQQKNEQADAIRVAYESAQSLLDLIGDILDLAKIESGNLELSPGWVNLDQLVSPVVRTFEGLARKKQLQLLWQPDNLPLVQVWTDEPRFKQILSNYLSNAIKFTDAGEIAVHAWVSDLTSSRLTLHVTIHDTGIGIAAEDQQAIFRPFVQLEAGKRQSGTGLGLAISQELLHKMAGNMTINSQPGQGTTIHLQLGLTIRPAQTDVITMPPVNAITPTLRILIVDDHPTNQMLLRYQLNHLHHQVTEASNGLEALERISSSSFDVVITDNNMPGMDGLMLTRCLREAGNPIMIFGLTANAQAEERLRGLEAGMNDCLFKPLRLEQLKSLLQNIVPVSGHPVDLSSLIDLEMINSLVNHDNGLLHKLLTRTKEENEHDIVLAQEHGQEQHWPGVLKCIHRIYGAAQVIGAHQIEALCLQVTNTCQYPENKMQILDEIEGLRQAILQLSKAIDAQMD